MKRKHIILLHVAFWLLLILNHSVPSFLRNTYFSLKDQPKDLLLFIKYFTIELGFYSITALCFYANYWLVAPQLFVKKNYWKALLYTILITISLIVWRYMVEFGFFKPVIGFDNYRGGEVTFKYYTTNIIFYYFPAYFIYGLMYFFAESWYRDRHRQQELEKERAGAELAFLRSQINPHFLFNSINDIYSLTYQKSEQAPEALLKLSEILRYMLRESNDELMSLKSEVTYLQNVIELQRISAKGDAHINFRVNGQIGEQQIPPLLFIAFVENAFKHGVINDPAHPIIIELDVFNNELLFRVANQKLGGEKDRTGGIGLQNVRRRLELTYPGEHQLTISDTAGRYTIDLSLQLI
ncbi:sensor histidine kinase [Mucilaginibacter myungsuensis]|uniref:Histidine kinase n=1 Tax=Mucilaginibacter myungsuensis TaxID=649104 RepID=A0A929KUA2_9SPHI|nr:histidine kinase [Mucilaginibacter myungsuensis]MBE9661691.1 histidine kinase [Mucilaginibacter myungsuensis]MDN3597835.1 histidine kinase [Mucilaginibacter myungsuensis]